MPISSLEFNNQRRFTGVMKALILSLLFLSACIAIPVPRDGTEGKGVAQTPPPAGQIHEQYVGLSDIPPKSPMPKISGRVFLLRQGFQQPLKYIKIVLKNREGKILFHTTSDTGGLYSFQEPLQAARYRLQIESDKYAGSIEVVAGNKHIRNADISAQHAL